MGSKNTSASGSKDLAEDMQQLELIVQRNYENNAAITNESDINKVASENSEAA